MKALRLTLLIAAITSTVDVATLSAQQTPPTPAPPSPVVTRILSPKPEDVSSIDAIITALYAVISGPKGQARDWNRMRSLFVPGAHLIPSVNRPQGRGIVMLTVNDYIATSGPMLTDVGFREKEIARRVEEFGSIAHVFSTYESFRENETAPFSRGINSIQLLNDGTRWWVVNIFWDGERQGLSIPEKYLKN